MKNLNWNFILLWFAITTLSVHVACNKSEAQSSKRVAAAALASDCIDTAGIYFPTIIVSSNATILQINQAHFIRVCDQVFVSGTLAGTNAIDTLQISYVKLSLPIASDLTAPPVLNLAGQAMDWQLSTAQPLNAPIGFLSVGGGSGAVISWRATQKRPYSIVYEFSYTIK